MPENGTRRFQLPKSAKVGEDMGTEESRSIAVPNCVRFLCRAHGNAYIFNDRHCITTDDNTLTSVDDTTVLAMRMCTSSLCQSVSHGWCGTRSLLCRCQHILINRVCPLLYLCSGSLSDRLKVNEFAVLTISEFVSRYTG